MEVFAWPPVYHAVVNVLNWLKTNEINFMEDWPPQSPDLNPIENLWDYCEGKLHETKCSTLSELWDKLQAIWQAIPTDLIKKLVDSNPRRIDKIVEKNGNWTGY